MPTLIVVFETGGREATRRLRNFAEDLARALEGGDATISFDEIDYATDHIHVHVQATRLLGKVQQTIEQTLRRHNLSAAIRRAAEN
jgi:hypothetical protein